MSTTYRPQALIHAHLPPPPSVPYSIPELRVPSAHDFASASSSTTPTLHSQHARSAAYSQSAGILGRVILNGHGLELRNFDLSISKTYTPPAKGSEVVRVLFPEPLRNIGDDFAILSAREGRLYVFAITESDTLYRLNFPLGSYDGAQGQRLAFVVESASWCEEWAIPDEVLNAGAGVGCWKVLDGAHVVLGMGDGGIIKLSRTSRGSWSAAHHRATSRLRLGGFFGRNGDEQIISTENLSLQDGSRLLYTLSRDWKLRIWNPTNCSLLRTLDIVTADGLAPGPIPVDSSIPLMRTIRHPSPSSRYSHLIVIYLYPSPNSTSSGSFAVYRASGVELSFAREKLGSAAVLGAELRGFDILPPPDEHSQLAGHRLQAAWYHEGRLLVETVGMDDVFQFSTYVPPPTHNPLLETWQTAYNPEIENLKHHRTFDSEVERVLRAEEPSEDANLPDLFVQEIFRPGKYSFLTMQSALEDYIQHTTLRGQGPSFASNQIAYPTLSKKYAAIVGSHLEVERNPQTGAAMIFEYRQALRQEWEAIWARCRDIDRQARWPLAISQQRGLTFILDREGLSGPCNEDVSSILDRMSVDHVYADNILNLPETAMPDSLEFLRQHETRSDLIGLLTGARLLVNGLDAVIPTIGDDEALDAGDTLFDTLLGIIAGGQASAVETTAATCWDEFLAESLSDETVSAIQQSLARCRNPLGALRSALDVLPIASSQSAMVKAGQLGLSGSGNALLACAIAATIESRLAISKSLVLIAFFLLALADGDATSGETEESEELNREIARAITCFHRYHILEAWAHSTGEEAAARARSKNAGRRKAANDELKPKYAEGRSTDSDGFDVEYSLLHNVLAQSSSRTLTTQPEQAFGDFTIAYLSDLDLWNRDQMDCAPLRQDVRFLYETLTTGQPKTAARLASLYPYTAGTAYVMGRDLLEDGLVEEAARDLQAAADAIEDGTLDILVPNQSVSDYYRHLCVIFDQAGSLASVALFGQKLLRLHNPADPANRDIWTKVFLAHANGQRYEDAYQTMALCPHPDLRRDLLSQLISVMCEANEVGRLTTLGFIGLQKEAEGILSFKARNSDPLRFPNYYKVLYTWHISRGDYRSAGEIMYIQGSRLGEALASRNTKPPVFEIRAMQARSLLAAVNALKLVDKRFAWVATSNTPQRRAGVKRKRTTSHIPADEFTADKHAIRLVTLEDIEAEYRLVLASLQLSRHLEELQEYGVSVKPDEVVGLLVQRDMFDLAQSAAESMKVDMIGLFTALAAKCVELSRLSSLSADSSAGAFLQSSPLTSRLRGSPSALALRYLQISLSRHDSQTTQYRLRERVADVFFEMNRDQRFGWQMPLWLVNWEMQRNPEGWISRALKHGWVKEAVQWGAELLRDATPPELLGKTDVAHVPYALIDRLIAAAAEGDEVSDAGLQKQVEDLREQVQRRIQGFKGRP